MQLCIAQRDNDMALLAFQSHFALHGPGLCRGYEMCILHKDRNVWNKRTTLTIMSTSYLALGRALPEQHAGLQVLLGMQMYI